MLLELCGTLAYYFGLIYSFKANKYKLQYTTDKQTITNQNNGFIMKDDFYSNFKRILLIIILTLVTAYMVFIHFHGIANNSFYTPDLKIILTKRI